MECIHRGQRRPSVIGGKPVDVYKCGPFKACTLTDVGLTVSGGAKAGVCEGCPRFTAPGAAVPGTIRYVPDPAVTGPELTIGMATYRDWPGVWATIQSLRVCHSEVMSRVQIVVVDNDPQGKPNEPGEKNHSFKVRQLIEKIGGKYEHYTDVIGTAAAKGRIFDLADAQNVLVMDCHVILPTDAVAHLMRYFQDNRRHDLLHGPCLGDGGYNDFVGTHFNETWGGMMFGQWGTDPRVSLDEPFEIPMQGCGLFACRKEAWPGFHPLLRGFGPEEWHIHQRFRRNGGRVLCLPWLRWVHRFGNPDGPTYQGMSAEERLRGHLVTYFDTGGDDWLESMRVHFVKELKGVTQARFNSLYEEVKREVAATPDPHNKVMEPVGDKLNEVLAECGIVRPTCAECGRWKKVMNGWGIAGCHQNRAKILDRLNSEAKAASWLEAVGVVRKGYLSTAMILDEAIKRAAKTSVLAVV